MYFDCMNPSELDELYEDEERDDRQRHDDMLRELNEEGKRKERVDEQEAEK